MERIATSFVAAVTVLAACKPPMVYSYQYRLTQDFAADEEPEPASVEARQLLAGARTVAFFPPDYCLRAGLEEGAAADQRTMRANCGVLLSSLERAAESVGYQVLSWQNLRGDKRPIDYAREAQVDVLFEINEFDLGVLDDSTVRRELTFAQRPRDGAERPLLVPAELASRCRGYAEARDPVQGVAVSGTIDIKTVSVVDGRNRWRYRKTMSRSLGREYPKVEFTAPRRSSKGSALLARASGVVLAAGITLIVMERVLEDDPSTPDFDEDIDFGPWDIVTTTAGVALLAGAIVLTARSSSAPPEQVLCSVDAVSATPATAAATSAAPGPVSASHTFEEQKATADPLEQERRVIRDAMISDFIDVLSAAHGLPAPAEPAPEPAPAPAPP